MVSRSEILKYFHEAPVRESGVRESFSANIRHKICGISEISSTWTLIGWRYGCPAYASKSSFPLIGRGVTWIKLNDREKAPNTTKFLRYFWTMEKENRSPESTQKGRRKSKRLSIGDALKLHTPVSYSVFKIYSLFMRIKKCTLIEKAEFFTFYILDKFPN